MHDFDWFVLECPEDKLRGFIAGWGAGSQLMPSDIELRFIWAKDLNIHTESLVLNLIEAIRSGHPNHVLVRRDTVAAFAEALAAHESMIRVRSRAAVRGAHFAFSFEIFSREEAQQVRKIFESLPPGLQLSPDYQPHEEARAEDRPGPEMYAPVHDYAFRARGTVSGAVDEVVHLYLRTRQHERIQVKHIELDVEPGSA